MYGSTRYLANNYLANASQITADTQYTGTVTGAIKNGVGSATMPTFGDYVGASSLIYTVEIDSVAGGVSVGQATFRWRESSMQVGQWGASGVLTDTSAIALNNGVEISFTAGAGNDFAVNDTFTFRALPTFGVDNLLQTQDRGRVFRSESATTAVTLTFDLLSSLTVTAFVLFDHNLTGSATITLEGNTTNTWGSPAYSTAVSVADTVVEYLSQSYRYWRVVIDDATNTTGYLEIGKLYLGSYTELSYNAAWGAQHDTTFNLEEMRNPFGVRRALVHTEQDRISLTYPLISNAEVVTIQGIARRQSDVASGRERPFFLHLFSDELTTFYLVYLIGGVPRNYKMYNYNEISLSFEEVVNPRV